MTKIKCILVILLAGLCMAGRAQHGGLDLSRLPEPVFSVDPGYVDSLLSLTRSLEVLEILNGEVLDVS